MKRASSCSLALSLCALGIKHHHSDLGGVQNQTRVSDHKNRKKSQAFGVGLCCYGRTPLKACCHEIFYHFSSNFLSSKQGISMRNHRLFHSDAPVWGLHFLWSMYHPRLCSLRKKRGWKRHFLSCGICHGFCAVLAGRGWSWPWRLWATLCWGATAEGSDKEAKSRIRSSKIFRDLSAF